MEFMNNETVISSQISSFLRNLEERGLKKNTIERKQASLNILKEWLSEKEKEEVDAKDINSKDLEEIKRKLKERGLKERTAEDHLNTLCEFLEYSGNKNLSLPHKSKKEVENDIQKIVNHYFKTKGYSLEEIKNNAKKRKIVYSRYTKPAKELLYLSGSVEEAKRAIDKVAAWANSRGLDYAIETVFKKWPELNDLKPKEKKWKPYFRGNPMVWSKTKKKWFVIDKNGEWLEFAGKEEDMEWKKEDDN